MIRIRSDPVFRGHPDPDLDFQNRIRDPDPKKKRTGSGTLVTSVFKYNLDDKYRILLV